MAIKHTIRNDDGSLVEVNLSPIKAIRRFCIECMGFQQAEIPRCTAPLCPLFPFRMGKAHKSVSPEQRKQMSDRAIRQFKAHSPQSKTVQESTIAGQGIVG